MKREQIIRMFAGAFILIGLALTIWVDHLFLIIPAFVGFNLLQSSVTKFCPLEKILKKFDIGQA